MSARQRRAGSEAIPPPQGQCKPPAARSRTARSLHAGASQAGGLSAEQRFSKPSPRCSSVVDPNGRSALLAQNAVRPKQHNQQEKDEKEHLAEGGCHVVAAERLDDADADAAEQRALN